LMSQTPPPRAMRMRKNEVLEEEESLTMLV
jgi:hypothetical protein